MKKYNTFINKYRIRIGPYGSDNSYENNGAFNVPLPSGEMALCIISDGMGWDHVSVSLENRCLTWDEMCYIKQMFWADDEIVMQLHPAKSEHINIHKFCLHLWKPQNERIPLPPSIMIGVKQ